LISGCAGSSSALSRAFGWYQWLRLRQNTKMRPSYDFKPGSRDERVTDERDSRMIGRPGIALRIRHVGGANPVPPTDPPIEP
jgi:hypothetical protein